MIYIYPGFYIQVSFCVTSLLVIFLPVGGEEKHCVSSPKFAVPQSKSYSSTDLGDGILDRCYGHGTYYVSKYTGIRMSEF